MHHFCHWYVLLFIFPALQSNFHSVECHKSTMVALRISVMTGTAFVILKSLLRKQMTCCASAGTAATERRFAASAAVHPRMRLQRVFGRHRQLNPIVAAWARVGKLHFPSISYLSQSDACTTMQTTANNGLRRALTCLIGSIHIG